MSGSGVPVRRRRRLPHTGGAGAVALGVVLVAALDASPPSPSVSGLVASQPTPAARPAPAPSPAAPGSEPGVAKVQASTATSTATSTPPSTSSPAAPSPGFTAQLESLYSEIYATYQASGAPALQPPGVHQLPTPDQYDALVAQIKPGDLAGLESALTKINGWSALPTTYRQLEQAAAAHPISAVAPAPTGAAGPHTPRATGPVNASSLHSSDFPPPEPVGTFPAPPQPYQPTSAVGPTTGLISCPQGAPGGDFGEDTIYSANLAADELDVAVSLIPDTIEVPVVESYIINIDAVLPDPARIAAAAVALSAHIVADNFAQEQGAFTNCLQNNWPTYLGNIDNTTTNVYGLVTLMESSLDQLESSVNTVHDQVSVIQQTADESLRLGIEQALTAPGCIDPNVSYEVPSSQGGNLDSTPIGVQEVVSSAISDAAKAGVAVNPVARIDMSLASSALNARSYKQAYADLCNAYQEAAK